MYDSHKQINIMFKTKEKGTVYVFSHKTLHFNQIEKQRR